MSEYVTPELLAATSSLQDITFRANELGIGLAKYPVGEIEAVLQFVSQALSALLPKATAPVVSKPVAWSHTTMMAIATLSRSVDGAFSTKLVPHAGKDPKGDMQDYEGPHVDGVTHEWVDQSGPGMSGDDFSGTVTFVLGDYHLVVEYAT